MKALFGIFEVVVNLFEYMLIFLFYKRQLGLLPKRTPAAVLVALFGAALTTLFNMLNLHPYFCAALLSVFDLMYAFFLFNGSKTRRVIHGLAPSVILSASEHLTVVIITPMASNTSESILSSSTLRFESQILYLFIIVAFFVAASSLKQKKGTYLPFLHRLFLIGLVTTCTFATSMLIYTTLKLIRVNYTEAAAICAVLSLVLLVICIGIVFLFYSLSSVYHKNNEMQIEMQKAEYEKMHNQDLIDTYQKMRSWKHDTTSRLGIIKTFAAEGKTEEIISFIGEAEEELSGIYNLVSTNHPAVDAVISNEISIAKSRGISIHTTLLLPEKLPLGDMDMCSIFSNLLENAIEAVNKQDIPSMSIELEAETRGGMLYIEVSNPSDGKYSFDSNGNLITTKTDNAGMHGLGLSRVKQIAEKGGGSAQFYPEKDKFTVSIIMPLPAAIGEQ